MYDEGKYRHAQEILDKLVYAEPQNQEAKDLLADCFEQFAYQQESPSVRNSFLAAAFELRSGIPEGIAPKSMTPDVIQAMSMALFLDYLGILVDSPKAEGVNFKINIVVPDENETHLLEMSNATLTNIQGQTAEDANLTLTVDKVVLMQVMMGAAKLTDLIESGAVKAEGDLAVLGQLKASMGTFDPLFEIMPGTKKN